MSHWRCWLKWSFYFIIPIYEKDKKVVLKNVFLAARSFCSKLLHSLLRTSKERRPKAYGACRVLMQPYPKSYQKTFQATCTKAWGREAHWGALSEAEGQVMESVRCVQKEGAAPWDNLRLHDVSQWTCPSRTELVYCLNILLLMWQYRPHFTANLCFIRPFTQ